MDNLLQVVKCKPAFSVETQLSAKSSVVFSEMQSCVSCCGFRAELKLVLLSAVGLCVFLKPPTSLTFPVSLE